MLSDRDYMQGSGYKPPMSMSGKLIIALVVIFMLQCINDVYVGSPIQGYLALTSDWIKNGYLWQLFTFQLLHMNLFHLLFNCLGLWFIGRAVENILGVKRYLFAFFGCGLIGGLLQGTLMVLFPAHYGAYIFGASAGVSGIFAIFARLHGKDEIRINFILPVRADVLLWISLGIAVFFTLVPTPRSGIAHAAHLGGLLAGIAIVRMGWHQDYRELPWDNLLKSVKRKFGRQRFIRLVPDIDKQKAQRDKPARSKNADFNASEIDPILDKISSKGIDSLTEEERKILEKSRGKKDDSS